MHLQTNAMKSDWGWCEKNGWKRKFTTKGGGWILLFSLQEVLILAKQKYSQCPHDRIFVDYGTMEVRQPDGSIKKDFQWGIFKMEDGNILETVDKGPVKSSLILQ